VGWEVVAGAVGGLVAAWLALVAALYVAARRQAEPTRLRDVARLVPDVLRLLRGLASDNTLPRGVRLRLVLLVGYLLLPVDLVPDFIPVVGWADDALVVVWALRSVVRRAGTEALDRHWSGSAEGLAALKRLAGIP
jgi:uncharacterized membrane protein YkvA (DUF1232 family)